MMIQKNLVVKNSRQETLDDKKNPDQYMDLEEPSNDDVKKISKEDLKINVNKILKEIEKFENDPLFINSRAPFQN